MSARYENLWNRVVEASWRWKAPQWRCLAPSRIKRRSEWTWLFIGFRSIALGTLCTPQDSGDTTNGTTLLAKRATSAPSVQRFRIKIYVFPSIAASFHFFRVCSLPRGKGPRLGRMCAALLPEEGIGHIVGADKLTTHVGKMSSTWTVDP
jgi:hypothetical protein